MIKKLIKSIAKDQKVIFRSWRSVLILIIGPLLIAALISMSFSNSLKYDVSIGVLTRPGVDPSLYTSLADKVNLDYHTDLNSCIYDTKQQKNYGCIDLKSLDNETEVTFYFDRSREILSMVILDYLKDSVQRSFMDSLDLGQIQEISSKEDELLTELREMKTYLKNQKTSINSMSDDLYTQTSDMEAEIDMTQTEIEDSIDNANDKIDDKIKDMDAMQSRINKFDNKLDDIDLDYYAALGIDVSELREFKSDINSEMNSIERDISDTKEDLRDMKKQNIRTESALAERMDSSKEKITSIQNYQFRIDNMNADIDNAIVSLDDMESSISQTFDFSLINIEQFSLTVEDIEYELPAVEDQISNVNSIRALFPIILVIMLIFISLVFSNIITKTELDSSAFLRWKLSPTSTLIDTLGLLISSTIIVMIQIAILLFAGNRIFFIEYNSNIWGILFVLILNVLIFSSIGITISYLIKNKSSSLLTAIFGVISFYILSGILLPIERTGAMVHLSRMLPSVTTMEYLRKVIFYNIEFLSNLGNIFTLVLQAAVFIGIMLFVAKIKVKE